MDKNQKEIAAIKAWPKKYYHLCTNGWKEGKLFNTKEQFKLGMSTIALIADMHDADILSFVLMSNHVHLLLNATGSVCLDVFRLIKHRTGSQLITDGFPPLPHDYGMKLIPVEDKKSLQTHFIYLARNAYEKGFCVPGGYPWGSEYLTFNPAADYIRGTKIGQMTKRDVRKVLGSYKGLPDEWEIHPELGVLPRNYIRQDVIRSLFGGSPKAYMTRLVKDYESFIHLSRTLEEDFVFSKPEAEDLMFAKLRSLYPGRWLKDLTADEKGRLAVELNNQYGIGSELLAEILYMQERVIEQLIHSKDYGYRKLKP
ncbi:MAG: transposase [Bacteroidales bacterium]|nr:transposase [Bacteroidales bacterium]